MKNMMKDAGILFTITLAAGLILGFVYQLTKEPIALAEEKAAREAYSEVFQDAAEFEELPLAEPDQEEWIGLGYGSVEIDKALEAKDGEGRGLGYVITVTTHEGYGGDITLTLGVRNDGTVNGISLLAISETAGLGMKAESVLKPQFENKKAPSFSYTKSGSTMDSQIDAISGATITTEAVVTAVNGGLYYFQTQLGGSANEAN